MKQAEAIKAVEAAIAAYRGEIGPGVWEAQEYRKGESVALVYDLEMDGDGPGPHPLLSDGSEPWKLWGGDEILAAAGLNATDGHAESYRSTWAKGTEDDCYYDAAIIPVEAEEE